MTDASRRSNLPLGMTVLPSESGAPEPSKVTAAQRRLAKAAAKRTTSSARRTRIPYGQSVAERLCEHIIAGGSLRSFCAVEGNPNKVIRHAMATGKPAFSRPIRAGARDATGPPARRNRRYCRHRSRCPARKSAYRGAEVVLWKADGEEIWKGWVTNLGSTMPSCGVRRVTFSP
jgi:hypothetical protein